MTKIGTLDVPTRNSVILASPELWANILKAIGPAQVYGSDELLRDGIARNVMGFKAIVPTNKIGSAYGFVVPEDAVATASRYLPPVFDDGASTKVVDDDNGFTISVRQFVNNCTGYGYVAATTLFGAKLLQPTKIVQLTK